MFPDVPFDKIVKSVEEAKGNLDTALQILLTVSLIGNVIQIATYSSTEEEDQLKVNKKSQPSPTPPSKPASTPTTPSITYT